MGAWLEAGGSAAGLVMLVAGRAVVEVVVTGTEVVAWPVVDTVSGVSGSNRSLVDGAGWLGGAEVLGRVVVIAPSMSLPHPAAKIEMAAPATQVLQATPRRTRLRGRWPRWTLVNIA